MSTLGLRIDPADASPIWRQIEQGVRRLVASGGLPSGEPLPSVRELALRLRVNPATVAKAYQRLTAAGILEVRRGDGTYVAQPQPGQARPGARLAREVEEAAMRYATVAATAGVTPDEAIEAVRSALEVLRGNTKEASS